MAQCYECENKRDYNFFSQILIKGYKGSARQMKNGHVAGMEEQMDIKNEYKNIFQMDLKDQNIKGVIFEYF